MTTIDYCSLKQGLGFCPLFNAYNQRGPSVGGRNKSKPGKKKTLDRLIEWGALCFYRLKIARKLMLGFSVLLFLLVAISVCAMFNLNRLNELNSSILNSDLPIVNTAEKMIDVIISQELYAQRYLILKTPDVLKRFWEKETGFIPLNI